MRQIEADVGTVVTIEGEGESIRRLDREDHRAGTPAGEPRREVDRHPLTPEEVQHEVTDLILPDLPALLAAWLAAAPHP